MIQTLILSTFLSLCPLIAQPTEPDCKVVTELEPVAIESVQLFSSTPISTVRKIDVLVEATSDLVSQFNSPTECSQYLYELFELASKSLRREINIEINVTSIITRTSQTTWEANCAQNGETNGDNMFSCFRSYWRNNTQQNPPRDIVYWAHGPFLGGAAGQGVLGGMCGPSKYARGRVYRDKINPMIVPTNNASFNLRVLLHEIGHCIGASHTGGIPIQINLQCSYAPTNNIEDIATIMGNGLQGLRFDSANTNTIECLFSNTFNCEQEIPITLQGDYNHDNLLSLSDIVDCRNCITWQYPYKSCIEVFDTNNDNQITACDCNSFYQTITNELIDCNSNQIMDGCSEDEIPDCNLNGLHDNCETNSTTDCNSNSIIDSCEPEPEILINYTGGRTISINFPNLCSKKVYIQILEGANTYYLQNDNTLGPNPAYKTYNEWGSVLIKSSIIKPNKEYYTEVRPYNNEATLTPIAFKNVKTQKWGDITGNNVIDQNDYNAIAQCYNGNFNNFSKSACDISPGIPDGTIDLDDILKELSAIGGGTYPY